VQINKVKAISNFPKDKKYQIIYADPPWRYSSKECLGKTSILNGNIDIHYKTMTISDLKKFPVGDIADKNCLLFLWVVSPMLDDCLDLLKAWGFKYVTIGFVWYKQRANPGHYTMSECEICLIGKIGKIPMPRGARNTRQFLSELRSKHSKKPDEIRKRISKMFSEQSKIELFAREAVTGWKSWGDEVPKPFTHLQNKLKNPNRLMINEKKE